MPRHPLLLLVDQHKARGRNRRECEVRFGLPALSSVYLVDQKAGRVLFPKESSFETEVMFGHRKRAGQL